MVKACLTPVSKTGDDLIWKWQQENNELRKALMYYADPKNYKRYGMSGIRKAPAVEVDRGKTARKALEVAGWTG